MNSYDSKCQDCKLDVIDEIDEYCYMLRDEVWELCNEPGYGHMLCISCVENRIGRQLTIDDFNEWIPLNCKSFGSRSAKLEDRMQFNQYEGYCPFCLKTYPDFFKEGKHDPADKFDPRERFPDLFISEPAVDPWVDQSEAVYLDQEAFRKSRIKSNIPQGFKE